VINCYYQSFHVSLEGLVLPKVKGGESLNWKASILVIDDDEGIRKTVSKILEDEGYLVETAENGEKAIEASKKKFFNIADMEGTRLLDKLKDTEPKMRKIIITGYPSLDNAIEAVNKGADAYILKPFAAEDLLATIEKQLEKQREEMRYSEEKVVEFIETRARQIEMERTKP